MKNSHVLRSPSPHQRFFYALSSLYYATFPNDALTLTLSWVVFHFITTSEPLPQITDFYIYEPHQPMVIICRYI